MSYGSGGVVGKEVSEGGGVAEDEDCVLGVTIFRGCIGVCWWALRMAVFGDEDFVGFGEGEMRELSSKGGGRGVVRLMK